MNILDSMELTKHKQFIKEINTLSIKEDEILVVHVDFSGMNQNKARNYTKKVKEQMEKIFGCDVILVSKDRIKFSKIKGGKLNEK